MEVGREFIEAVRARQFKRLHDARAWWKGMTKEQQREALARWVEQNPDDFRAGWGIETVSLTHGTIADIWDLNVKK